MSGTPTVPAMEKVNLAEKFSRFHEHWSPRIVGELNGQHVKLAKLQGEFLWHHHENEDELFLVVKGKLELLLRHRLGGELQEQKVELDAGELFVVPKGVEHKPVAPQEVQVLLFEPQGTLNTGEQKNERTVDRPEWI